MLYLLGNLCHSLQWTLIHCTHFSRVMALLPKGGYADLVAVNEDHAMTVPDNLKLSEASGIPEAWLTAYQLLHLVGEYWYSLSFDANRQTTNCYIGFSH